MAEKERLEAVVKKLSLKFQKKADEHRKYEEIRAKFQEPFRDTVPESIHRELFIAAPSMKKKKPSSGLFPQLKSLATQKLLKIDLKRKMLWRTAHPQVMMK